MTNPTLVMALIDSLGLAGLGASAYVTKKVLERRLKEKRKHTRGRKPHKPKRQLSIGESRDAVFLADKIIQQGDKAVDSLYMKLNKNLKNKKLKKSLLKGYEAKRFEKNFAWIENKIERKTHKNLIKHQSALRRWYRVQAKAGKSNAIIDRSLKDMKRILQ